jgi:hypothetical protein
LLECETGNVQAILVYKKLLKRLHVENIIEVPETRVIPFITKGEYVKLGFETALSINHIKGSRE